MIDIVNYEHRDIQTVGLANRVGDELNRCLAARGRATLAVPGGRTPLEFLRELSTKRLAWEKINVILTDEHFVPESSEKSNTRMVRETLLQNCAGDCNLLPFWQDGLSPERLAHRIGRAVEDVLPIDVCVLGMGVDMRTASLLPDADQLSDALMDTERRNVVSLFPKDNETPRITLTAPILAAANHLHLLIVGREKRMALGRAIKAKSTTEAPIKALIEKQNPLHVHFAA